MPELTTAATETTVDVDNDYLPMVDVSEAPDGLNKVTPAALLGEVLKSLRTLADPGGDHIPFWDESANAAAWLQIGTNLNITGTTLNADVGGGGDLSALGTVVTDSTEYNALITTATSNPTINYIAIVSDNIVLTSILTQPKNMVYMLGPDGKFTDGGGGGIIHQGVGVVGDPQRQVYSGFTGTDLTWTGAVPKPFRPEWMDTEANFVTDCLAAFNKLREVAPFNVGLHIDFIPGKLYNFSDTWAVDYKIEATLPGEFGAAYGAVSGIRVPANKTWLILHAEGTRTGASEGGRSSVGSVIKGLFIAGNNEGASIVHTHTVNVTGLTVTRTAGTTFISDNGFIDGLGINIGDVFYIIDEVVGSNTLDLKAKATTCFATNGSPTITNAVPTSKWDTTGGWDGQDIIIDGVTYEIDTCALVVTTQTITLTTNYTGPSTTVYGYVQGMNTDTGLDARPDVWHGIDNRANARIEGNYIWSFPGNAIHNTELGPGLAGNTPNQNNARTERNMCYDNHGSGLFSRGTNANQQTISNNDLTGNQGYGYWDHSFLGNTYLGNHTSFNYSGSAHVSSGVNVSVFLCEYSEGGQPPSFYGTKSLLLGGNHGAGFLPGGEGITLLADAGMLALRGLNVARTIQGIITKAFVAGFANSSAGNVLFGFGAGEEDANISAGYSAPEAKYPAYQLNYNEWQTGAYGLHGKSDALGTFPTPPIAFTGSEHALGIGQLLLPKGFYGGNSGTRRKWDYVSAIPTSGTVALGDIFWNNGSDCGSIIGWIVTTAGTIGSGAVLTEFGPGAGGGGGIDPPRDFLGSNLSLSSAGSGSTMADTSIVLDLAVARYHLDMFGMMVNGAGGLKIDFDSGDCVVGGWRVAYESLKLGGSFTPVTNSSSARSDDFAVAGESATVYQVEGHGSIDISTAGDLIMRAAQVSSNAEETLLLTGWDVICTPM